jgi:hypothetical protein
MLGDAREKLSCLQSTNRDGPRIYLWPSKGTGARVLDLRVSTPFLLVNASLEESNEYPIAQFNG